MSVFKIPNFFCDEIRKLVAQFWWGQKAGERKIHWVAWKKLCAPKDCGGLGYRDYQQFNMALLGKQAWRLCIGVDSLAARVLKGKYYPTSSFFDATLGHNPSYTWRSILEGRSTLLKGVRRRVGDGASIKIWSEPWIPGTQTGLVISRKQEDCAWEHVSELMVTGRMQWDAEKVRRGFLPFEAERILSIPLSARGLDDSWFWPWEKDGEYSVRSAYKILHGWDDEGLVASSSESNKWIWAGIWQSPILPRIKTFFWQLCKEALPTKARITKRMGRGDGLCPVCWADEEGDLHVFRDCGWVRGFWAEDDLEVVGRDVSEWVSGVWELLGTQERVRFMTACWVIWNARNRWVFEGEEVSVRRVRRRELRAGRGEGGCWWRKKGM
ncbi:hypothetical protein RND81_12G195100 [Saponaria officinalis]|uniref:Reverse transcriptase zinc-binding domain-containing protein n=1 Tax=Saponaria officinalis TaxID=3572 RepID=A0AAW1HCX3_SAPOF